MDALQKQLADEIQAIAECYEDAGWEIEEFDDALQSMVDGGRRGDRWVGVGDVVAVDMVVAPPEGAPGSEERTQTNKEGNEIAAVASYEASVVWWSRFRMPRLIGHWIIRGEPGDKATDDELEALIKRKFRKADVTEMLIQATTIDMGGHYPDQARAFAHKHRKNNVLAICGANLAKGTRKPTVWPSGRVSRSGKVRCAPAPTRAAPWQSCRHPRTAGQGVR